MRHFGSTEHQLPGGRANETSSGFQPPDAAFPTQVTNHMRVARPGAVWRPSGMHAVHRRASPPPPYRFIPSVNQSRPDVTLTETVAGPPGIFSTLQWGQQQENGERLGCVGPRAGASFPLILRADSKQRERFPSTRMRTPTGTTELRLS